MDKPLIGISSYLENEVHCAKEFHAPELFISYPEYDQCIAKAGGLPLNLPVINQKKVIQNYAEMLDGLVLCGGEDVLPECYDEKAVGNYRHVPERDQFEIELFHAFAEMKKPVMGICRGMQVINVCMGGTLIQDIPSEEGNYLVHTRGDVPTEAVHDVNLDGFLKELFGSRYKVNSMHHQAVKKLGQGLKMVGRSEDGIIEAFSSQNGLIIGIQWHPEMLQPSPSSLFEYFIHLAVERKNPMMVQSM